MTGDPVLKSHKSQEPEPNLHSCLTRKPRLRSPHSYSPDSLGQFCTWDPEPLGLPTCLEPLCTPPGLLTRAWMRVRSHAYAWLWLSSRRAQPRAWPLSGHHPPPKAHPLPHGQPSPTHDTVRQTACSIRPVPTSTSCAGIKGSKQFPPSTLPPRKHPLEYLDADKDR